ncbi:sensor histidine kinase [Lentibacillus jeotgali]|uniref:sensor histidine kinase n=1 Tax=Lentibacillus jeotgali TaxID=558169 RepID=UPI0002628F60|nr:HAMP domain-containing sensor histidine kinase [Lentibacillus jeotgali]
MRTLYVRIIVITMAIMIASAIVAFAVTNIYYQIYLKPENDQKITHIAKNIESIYEGNSNQSLPAFLTSIADLGYKFYLVNQNGDAKTFGESFSSTKMEQSEIQEVLNGDVYHGIRNYPWKPFVTGFFDNHLENTIGVPIEVNGATYALFVRPDTMQQFGEMRIFLAVLLILTLLFSFLMVLISTQFVVKPIKKLTEATKKIAAGNYHLKMDVHRHDEIGRLASDFKKMSDSLERTEEKRQEFVSSVSHEIQSPLTSIQGFSRAIKDENLTEKERSHYLTIIEKESKRLSLLSKQLLTLTSLDHEKEMEMIRYDAAEQLKEVVLATEWQWQEKDITIEMDLVPTTVTGDPSLLFQVWMNLAENAIRYTETGGTITIRSFDDKTGAWIVVEDTGIGIAIKDLPFLFDQFYKVDKARTRTENSTGLGLSITKKVIELHRGTIMVDSEPGKGSTFTVNIPYE